MTSKTHNTYPLVSISNRGLWTSIGRTGSDDYRYKTSISRLVNWLIYFHREDGSHGSRLPEFVGTLWTIWKLNHAMNRYFKINHQQYYNRFVPNSRTVTSNMKSLSLLCMIHLGILGTPTYRQVSIVHTSSKRLRERGLSWCKLMDRGIYKATNTSGVA